MSAGAEVLGDVAGVVVEGVGDVVGVVVEGVGDVSSNKLGAFFCSFVPILASSQFQFLRKLSCIGYCY